VIPTGRLSVGMYTDTMLPRLDGIAISLEAVGNALEDLGASIEVVGPRQREPYEGTLKSRTVSSLRPWGRDYNAGLILPWLRSSRTSAACYDIVHVHTLGPIGLAGLASAHYAGIPAILTWHTDIVSYRPYYPEVRLGTVVAVATLWYLGVTPNIARIRFSHRLALRGVFSLLDTVVVPTPKAQGQVLGLGCQRPIIVLPSPTLPLPVPSITPAILRGQLGIPPEAPVILSVGRLSAEKNEDLLVQAFAHLRRTHPTARLVLVGALAGRRRIMRLATNLGIAASVLAVGVVQRESLGAYYDLANVCVIPSLSETQSIVALEAEAFELPVAVVDGGLASGPNGLRYLAEPDPISLGRVIHESLVSTPPPEDTQFPSPDRYNPRADDQAKDLLGIYESILGSRP
jgi:1,2-diacylglycerol 3-alpha-glucosyltransferase